MAFKYSLNSSTVRSTPLLKKIEVAAKAGYKGIELWHDDLEGYVASGGRLQDVRKALDDHGLVAPTTIYLKGWCEPDGPAHKEGIEECKRRLEQAVIVGAPHTIAGPPGGMVDYELAGRRYAELLSIGRGIGVLPSVEYLGFVEDVNSIAKGLRIMQIANQPDATIVLDPFHDFRGGAGCDDIVKLRAEQIAVCHFDDAPGSPPAHTQHDGDRVMPGEGVIDLKKFVRLLKQVGYSGFVSLELFREDLWRADPLEVARTGLQKMRAICEA
jgi:sugar phosphate isomerase/epimerase